MQSYTWRFPFSNGGTEQGYNVPGLENFRSTPYESLAREICQNSLDAAAGKPVRVVFETKQITQKEFPGFDAIKEAIQLCVSYWLGDKNTRRLNKKNLDGMKAMAKRVENITKHNTLTVLRISDYNTHGARGSNLKSGSEWTGLVREIGSNIKVDGSGGSVGVGKYAPFLLSGLRTLFYGTIDETGKTAFQGHAILTSFADEKGKGRQGDGFWGFYDETEEWNKPLTDFEALKEYFSPLFTRKQVGTDIFVMDFKQEDAWQEQLVCSIINNFFFSIWNSMLEVQINDIVIKKDTLSTLIQQYGQSEQEDASLITIGKYFSVLCPSSEAKVFHVTNKDSYSVPKVLQDMGDFELFFTFGQPEDKKGLLKMRRQGMTIEETSDFCRGMVAKPLCIFRAIGQPTDMKQTALHDINMILQECEDGRHNCWKEANCKDETIKRKARTVLRAITSWIKEVIQANGQPLAVESLPAFGVQLTSDEDGEEPREIEAFSDVSFGIFTEGKKKRKARKDISSHHTTDFPDEEETTGDTEGRLRDKYGDLDGDTSTSGPGGFPGGPGTKGPTGNESTRVYPPGEEPGFTNGYGSITQQEKAGKAGILGLNNVRVIWDETRSMYRIAFTPKTKCLEAYVVLKVKNYDNRMEPIDIQMVMHHGDELPFEQNEIGPIQFTAGKRIALDVTLKHMGRYTLGVDAYAKK